MPTKTNAKVLSLKELREKAKAKGIAGYSKMEKRQLFKALPNPNKKQPSAADLKLPRVSESEYWHMDENTKADLAPCIVVDYVKNADDELDERVIKKISPDLTETHFDKETILFTTNANAKVSKGAAKAPAKKAPAKKTSTKKKGPSKKELQAKAKEAGITGFSKMNVDELKEALKKPAKAPAKKAPAKAPAKGKKAPAKETSAKPKGVSKAKGASMAKTRAQLVGMAKRRKIEGIEDMNKTQLVAAIKAAASAKKAPAKKAPAKGKKAAPAKGTKKVVKKKGPSKADLQAKAKKKGIKGFSKMNKDQLVAALK